MVNKTSLRNRIRPFVDIKRLAQDQEIKVSLKTEGTSLSTDNLNISDENLIRFDHQKIKWVK
jgi:hypothetical protein